MTRLDKLIVAVVVIGLALSIALLLAGCGAPGGPAPEPRIVTQEVKVAVPTRCTADPGPDPAYADDNPALAAAADLYERVKLLLEGRAQRQARELELKAANSACR